MALVVLIGWLALVVPIFRCLCFTPRIKDNVFTFAKKVMFWVAFVCMFVEDQNNSRTTKWIVLIFGMWVGLNETWKRIDFGPPSGLLRYCKGISGFDMSSSEHTVAMIF